VDAGDKQHARRLIAAATAWFNGTDPLAFSRLAQDPKEKATHPRKGMAKKVMVTTNRDAALKNLRVSTQQNGL